MGKTDLDELRIDIDSIDKDILRLLNNRMNLAQQVGKIKQANNQDVFDSSREDEVLNKLSDLNIGPLLNATLRAVYREIFSGSRALQSHQRIAFLGPIGTYSYEAATRYFGKSGQLIPCASITEIFEEMEQNFATSAVVPVENSIEGSVRETLDMLMLSSLEICAEVSLRISHALMNVSGKIEDIKQVMSHPQALAQCRQWLNRNIPGIPLSETSSTAKAAKNAIGDPNIAAIGNERFGVELGLSVIRRAIQDKSENITRFYVLGRQRPPRSRQNRTSIVFWTEDKPGALYTVLEKFSKHKINLSRIESRPDRGLTAWKYAFFVDLEGYRDDPDVAGCLKEVTEAVTNVKVLGSFPVEELPETLA
jgi:chorismate mutase / prephenate dehydratase